MSTANEINLNKIKTQADAVIHFLQRLDVEMVSDILEDSRTYQDFEKSIFIKKLSIAIDEFVASGDIFLNCYRGCCNSETCNYDCEGFTFSGNKSKNFIDLVIITKDGVVQDMYECINFKNLDDIPTLNERIKINKF
ncbi:MAG: hypothetical protein ABIP35_09920 [Ginsengibacter sp.]